MKAERQCINCSKDMDSGYVFDNNEYYCSEKCLNTKVTAKEWNKLHTQEPDSFYWTIWYN